MSEIIFSVAGQPIPQARPRMTRTGHVYTPEKSKKYRELVRACAIKTMDSLSIPIMTDPVNVELKFYMEIPKSWSRKKKQAAADGVIYPGTKPDVDNLVKMVLDAMNKGAVYHDDSQVVSLVAKKRYSDTPRVWVRVWVTDRVIDGVIDC